MSHYQITRRRWLQAAGASLFGASASGWLPTLARAIGDHPNRRRHCILLWMAGGPSQTDTFDMKPDHQNGGEFTEIASNVPGLRFSEHLPTLAKHADRLAVVRSLSTREGDHARGTQLMRTGKPPGGPVQYPSIGAALAKELSRQESNLPDYVSIGTPPIFSPAAFGPGFLGPKYAPTTVGVIGDPQQQDRPLELGVNYLAAAEGVPPEQLVRRRRFWQTLQQGFLDKHDAANAAAHDTVYRRAMRMMDSDAAEAFNLSQEADDVRAAYGQGVFGQGCLLARRLVERGVPFVEVTLGGADGNSVGWDTHQDNFNLVRNLSGQLDAGWGNLMSELAARGLLEDTTILWMGEFGRTPAINENAGRDHFPQAWSCVFAGGGVAGGQAYGKTTPDGMEVADNKVEVGDVLVTLCSALGVDPETENTTNQGRPIKIAEGTPIKAILS